MDGEERPRYRLFLDNIAEPITSRRTNFSETALVYLDESGKTALVYLDKAERFFTDVLTGLRPGLESARERTTEGYQNLKQEGQRLSKIVESALAQTTEGYQSLKQEGQRLFTGVVTGLKPGLESACERTTEGYQTVKQEGQRLSKIVGLKGYNLKNAFQRDVQNVVEGLKAKREQLSQLMRNPRASYKSEDPEERPSTSEE